MYEHVMKALRNLALALMVPVLASSLSAAEKPEIVDEYLPVGKMAEAAAVSVVLDESLQPFMEKIDGVFASLPDKDKKELVGQIVPGQPVPYDERLGWTKDEYAKYLECWKLKQVQEVAPVALGIFASGERNIWDLAAVAQQGPLPMSTLKYDSSTKSWISPNGTLTLKGDVSYDELNVYGAWSGKEWTMEKKTILSTLTETIIAARPRTASMPISFTTCLKRTRTTLPLPTSPSFCVFPSPASRVTLCWKRPRPRPASRDMMFLSFPVRQQCVSSAERPAA